jgi:hypothetical protein
MYNVALQMRVMHSALSVGQMIAARLLLSDRSWKKSTDD